jgi:hypothetical protein
MIALRLSVLLLTFPLVLGSAPASAEPPNAVCREACRERNVDASCAWLTMKPRRCFVHAVRECRKLVRADLPAACPLPPDLPACLTNQSCPYGSLCADATCQVIGCDDVTPCPGHQACEGGRCVVDDCGGSSQNCPKGFHCIGPVANGCQPDDPTRTACMTDTDCIAPGEFNPRCLRGVCAARARRRACEADGDCFAACKTSTAAVRVPRCNSAGQCVCANCESGGQCDARFNCGDGQTPVCLVTGVCYCPAPPSPPPGGTGVCTAFETPACTPCRTDADCGGGFDVCLQSASCIQTP